MKHPVLARVFAVVLAILCLLMLLNGVSGFGKTEKAQQERAAFEAKYAQRIETYRALDEQVKSSISYDEAYEQYKAFLEQHDKDAAQHRTDTALYTAEKGGNTMGANMIWEAMPEVESAKQELAAAKAQLQSLEAAYMDNKGTIEETVATANQGIADCDQASAGLALLPAKLAPLLAEREKLPAMPIMPDDPLIVEDPGVFELSEPQRDEYVSMEEPTMPQKPTVLDPENPTEEEQQQLADFETQMQEYYERKGEYDRQIEEYEKALAAYNKAKQEYDQQLELFQKNDERQQKYDDDMTAYYRDLEEYSNAQREFQRLLYEQLAPEIELAQRIGEEMNTCVNNSQAIASATGMDIGGMGGADLGGFSLPSEADLVNMSPEQFMGQLQSAISMMRNGFQQIASGMGSIEGELANAQYKVAAGEKALKEGEHALKAQLENIWYNLEQLEEKADELKEEKEQLDLEALSLDKKLMETEELKALKNKHISTRQLLIQPPEVKRMVSEGGDLVQSAESYLESYRAETQRLYTGRRLLNLLAVIGGIAGILGIPTAYEKIRGRFWLLSPVVICLGCAIGADAINMRLGLGQMYTALFTAIFAALQLLILLPKEKVLPME